MNEKNTQIEQKIQSKIVPSPAVLAATLGAMASAANAGHNITVESKNIDLELAESIRATLADDQFRKELQGDSLFDFSISNGHLLIDAEEEKISEELLMYVAGLGNRVDADAHWCKDDLATECWDTNCYTNCHSNCHGSRSWR
jgi:hypothetical protein